MKKVKVHLQGKLKEICDGNDVVELGAGTPRMAIRALESMFGHEVRQHIGPNKWHMYIGEDSDGNDISERDIDSKLTNNDLYIIPYVEGASGRTGQVILGVVLVVAGVFLAMYDGGTTLGAGTSLVAGSLVSAGVGMILQAFFAPDEANMRERPEERNSFLFSGATNTSEQGQPVPLIFGRFRTGSVVVSAGLDVEELMNYWIPPYEEGSGGGGTEPIDPGFPPYIDPD